MEMDIVSKSEFAALMGVRPPTVSAWLKRGRLTAESLVGAGHRARINVPVAREQLRRYLDDSGGRATSTHAPGRAAPAGDQTLEDAIKTERRDTLRLNNARLREDAALRAGKFCLTADAVQSEGRIVGRLLNTFTNAFSNALVAEGGPPATLRILKQTWDEIRNRDAALFRDEASELEKLTKVEP